LKNTRWNIEISLYRVQITIQNYFFDTSGGKTVGLNGGCDRNTKILVQKKDDEISNSYPVIFIIKSFINQEP